MNTMPTTDGHLQHCGPDPHARIMAASSLPLSQLRDVAVTSTLALSPVSHHKPWGKVSLEFDCAAWDDAHDPALI